MVHRNRRVASFAMATAALAGVIALAAAYQPAAGAPGQSWTTTIAIQNLASVPSEAAVSYYSTSGVLLKKHPAGAIPPKGTLYLDSNSVGELPANFAGSAVV